MTRRYILGLLLGMVCLASEAIHAQTIRFFVRKGNGLYEVLENRLPKAGGRFIDAPTREIITFPAGQFPGGLPGGSLPVLGYTGQAQRGELFIGRVEGSGQATFWVTFQDERSKRIIDLLPPRTVRLPHVSPLLVVPSEVERDNLTANVRVGSRLITRRLPLGRR